MDRKFEKASTELFEVDEDSDGDYSETNDIGDKK